MTTQNPSTPTPAPAVAPEPGAAAPASTAASAAGGSTAPDWYVKETARLREEKRNAEEKSARLEAEQAAAATKKLEDEKQYQTLAEQRKTELEAKNAELASLQAKQSDVYVQAELRALARELVDPEDIKLFDASGVKVVDGKVEGLDAAWAAFREKKKHLLRADGLPAPAGLPARPGAAHPPAAGGHGEPPDPTQMTQEQWHAHVATTAGAGPGKKIIG